MNPNVRLPMFRYHFCWLWTAVVAVVLSHAAAPAARGAATPADVDKAIAKAREYLYSQMDPKHFWEETDQPDPKGGGVEHGARVFNQSTCHHTPEIYAGLDEERSAMLLKAFFQGRR